MLFFIYLFELICVVETATMYAKILIGELCLDDDYLTIKPKNIGGDL
jgi:hypothetical protein